MLVGQQFALPTLQTMEYLNDVSGPNFYAVEVVRFRGGGTEALEARVIGGPGHPPSRRKEVRKRATTSDE